MKMFRDYAAALVPYLRKNQRPIAAPMALAIASLMSPERPTKTVSCRISTSAPYAILRNTPQKAAFCFSAIIRSWSEKPFMSK